jgi:hypothetical protein
VGEYFRDVNANWTIFDTPATPCAGSRIYPILAWIIIELAEEPVSKPLTLRGSGIVSAGDAPVNRPCTAIPTTNSIHRPIGISLVPYVEAPAGRTDVSTDPAAQAPLSHLLPIRVFEKGRPGVDFRNVYNRQRTKDERRMIGFFVRHWSFIFRQDVFRDHLPDYTFPLLRHHLNSEFSIYFIKH